jgi:hypothetical protein
MAEQTWASSAYVLCTCHLSHLQGHDRQVLPDRGRNREVKCPTLGYPANEGKDWKLKPSL